MTYSCNQFVLFTSGWLNERTIGREMEYMKRILPRTETPEQFCTAFELVDRNRITSSPRKILKEAGYLRLRQFRFLINRN